MHFVFQDSLFDSDASAARGLVSAFEMRMCMMTMVL
mgnify:CR=1 FL=1